MDLYHNAIESVANGARFKIDLISKTLTINGADVSVDEMNIDIPSCEDMISTIEKLYERYKHSVPSERSECKRRRYFTALRKYDIDEEDFMFGEGRDVAQIKLELYVLLSSIHYRHYWDSLFQGFFYQSKADKDLIILKDWVC